LPGAIDHNAENFNYGRNIRLALALLRAFFESAQPVHGEAYTNKKHSNKTAKPSGSRPTYASPPEMGGDQLVVHKHVSRFNVAGDQSHISGTLQTRYVISNNGVIF
jgi:hypothetical protein